MFHLRGIITSESERRTQDMKKALVVIGIVIGTVAIIFLVAFSNRYSLDAVVTEKEDDTTIIIEDSTGNIWAFEDENSEYAVGDKVRVTWNDKGTDFKEDDEILKVEIK
jgi:hypothetical protein